MEPEVDLKIFQPIQRVWSGNGAKVVSELSFTAKIRPMTCEWKIGIRVGLSRKDLGKNLGSNGVYAVGSLGRPTRFWRILYHQSHCQLD